MPKQFKVQDKYFKKAKEKGYLARSAFKLEEIQEKFKILKREVDVLDLGAAPGSWLQVASRIVGGKARLIGIDLQPIDLIIGNVITWQGDIFSLEAEKFIQTKHPDFFPVILSDMAPATSGIKDADQARSIELANRVIELSDKFLARNGVVVIKVFQGSDFDGWLKGLKSKFKKIDVFKPKSSRDRSFEVYVIARK